MHRPSAPISFLSLCLATILAASVVGCQDANKYPAANGDRTDPKKPKPKPCAVPEPGCPCAEEGASLECGTVKEKRGEYVLCSKGVRLCTEATWGECIAQRDELQLMAHRSSGGGRSLQALGGTASCNNVCDPLCLLQHDTPTGIVVGDDLFADSNGVTLPGTNGGGSCADLSLSPTTATVTVSAIATDGSVTASPASVTFSALCNGVAAVQPSWTIDSYDRAVISGAGVVTVFSGIGSPITVTGSTALDTATATVNVQVLLGAALQAKGATADPGATLYPYKNTVFPLDLKAPLVQYSTGGVNATQVQVILRYPVGAASPTFRYAKTYSADPKEGTLNTALPAWQIPQEVWTAFDHTVANDATNKTGEILIRRRNGGTIYNEMTIPVKFATDSLHGTVYYTQYQRTLYTASTSSSVCSGQTDLNPATYTPGNICPVGNCTHPGVSNASMTRAIDLGQTSAPNTNPFNPTNNPSIVVGCPVCHSVSANGSVYVSGNQYWQTTGGGNTKGLASIGGGTSGEPLFTGTGVAPNYYTPGSGNPSEQSRGFAYSGISPDGSLVLQAPTFWGNTKDIPAANNTQDASLMGVTSNLRSYFFARTTNPGLGVQFAPTGALPANTRSGSALTATANAALVIDGVTMASGHNVLVWNESTAANNGVYTVTATGSGSAKWTLTRRSDADGSGDMLPGMDVRVTDGNANRNKIYHITAPTTGTITPNTTAITFAPYASPVIAYSTPRSANYATTAALTPVGVTRSGNVLTAGALGILNVDGTNLSSGASVLVQDESTAANNGVYTVTNAGVPATGAAFAVQYATTAALAANTRSANILTATGFGPLAVDGTTLALNDSLLVKDEAAGANNGIYTLTTLGIGSTSTPLNAQYATAAALPANTASGNVLTATGYGALTVDGTALALADSVLVKNETAQAYNGVYTLTTLGAGSTATPLSVQYATTAALATNSRSGNILTASSNGTLSVDGTTLGSGASLLVKNESAGANNGIYTVTAVGATGTGTPLNAQYATAASLPSNALSGNVLTSTAWGALVVDGSPLALNDAVLVKDEATQSKNGIYTLTTLGTGASMTPLSVVYATAAALSAHTQSGNVLTGSTWGPLAVDGGALALNDSVLVKDETSPAKNGVYTLTTLGTGSSMTPGSVQYATTAALATNTLSGNVLTASGWGALTVDGAALALNDSVLVKDEATQLKNGVYTLTTLGTGSVMTPLSAQYATAAALPTNTLSGVVLTSSGWGALTVDGVALALNDSVLVKDEATQSRNGIYTLTTLGTGSVMTPLSAQYATAAALPTNTLSGNVLTASGWGSLSVDGVALALNDSVLVKDEVVQSKNGIYTLTTLGTGSAMTPLSVQYATAASLSSYTQSGNVLTGSTWGPLSVDGTTLALNDSVLVKNEATGARNGIYTLTTLGTGAAVTPVSVQYATTAALATNSQVGNVLTATGWGPLTVDGVTLALNDSVLVKDEAAQAKNGIYTVTTLGTGTATTSSVQYATAAALPTNTRSGNVLTASANGILSIDSIPVALGSSVLVKNEITQANNGVYTVTATGSLSAKWTLTRRADSDATGEITAGEQVSVTAGLTNLNKTFYVSLPASGTITVNTTSIGFTLSAQWQLTRRADSDLTGEITPGEQVGVTAGASNINKTFYVSSPSSGSIIINISSIAFTQSALWQLTRRTDSDATGDITAGEQVSVTGGASNINKTFYVSSPASGTITINTTSIGFTQSVQWKLTRRADSDATGDITPGEQVSVTAGGTNLNKTFYVSSPSSGTITINTTNIGFTQSAQWKLTRRADSDVTGDITAGEQVSVTAGGTNLNKTFYVSSPPSGTITINTTNIGFSQSVQWRLTRRADSDVTGEITPGEQVSVTAGASNINKTFYVSSPSSGTITINTSSIVFAQSALWQLTRRSDADTTGEITPGEQVSVTSGSANSGKTFYVSSPSSGTITVNTTGITFSQSTLWRLTRRSDADTTGEITPGLQVTIAAGSANSGDTYYVSTPASGTITINSTNIGFSLASPWQLTRRNDADVTGEITPGMQTSVGSGTSNGGKTFYVSTPSSGTITINTTAMAFTQSALWKLTRRTDADATGEITPGLQVSIASGASNTGKTFYVSTPSSGTITVNTTAIAFGQSISWQLTRRTDADTTGDFVPGSHALISSGTSNAGKYFYISSPSSGTIALNTTAMTFSLGAPWTLTRRSDSDGAGEFVPGSEVAVASGSTNANRIFHLSSPTTGAITINTTAISFSDNTLPAMMVPVFSPDGTKVAYVNGDADTGGGLAETGWRRGLSMFSVNTSAFPPSISGKKRLINNWTSTWSSTTSVPVKWPFWEPDSRSLVYVETDPNEFCSTSAVIPGTAIGRACSESSYGSMSPTTRGYWPGKMYSIDTAAATPSTTRVELSKLNDAEDSTDADKAYQPTVLPFSSGGYRWVIFTSPRAYGNQLNEKSGATPTDFSCAASMLWMSAITDETASTTDRSNPAFLLPGQNMLSLQTLNHYVNERGYLVPSVCKSEGDSCTTDEDCCGADGMPATAACRAPTTWTPADGAPAKTCELLTGTCHNGGESCSTTADCCNGVQCSNFSCTSAHFEQADFVREYTADCPTAHRPDWQLFSYHLTTEGDSRLVFSVQTVEDLDDLDAAPVISVGQSSGTAVSPANPEYTDVGGALDAANTSRHLTYLRMIVSLVPSTDGVYAPLLHDWEMRYTCQPDE